MSEIGRLIKHKTTHQSGGSDELDLSGLSPAAHKVSHQFGGSDQLDLLGNLVILPFSASTLLTNLQVLGQLVLATAALTITLPPVVFQNFLTIYSVGANLISVAPNSNDRIVLEGVAGGDGKKISSASGAGNLVTLFGDSSDGWTVVGWAGTWTMEA